MLNKVLCRAEILIRSIVADDLDRPRSGLTKKGGRPLDRGGSFALSPPRSLNRLG